VLLLTDPIDEFVVSSLNEYRGKQLKAVDRGEPEGEPVEADRAERFKPLLEYLKRTLPEAGDVRLSRRLTESAACLVAPEGGMSAHTERLLTRMGRDSALAPKRVLELNPDHAAVSALRDLHERSPEDTRLEGYARLLFDQAVLAEGSKLGDPVALARSINELIARDARQ
jgi:molecular chaperone HtpG